jgi:CheY-like chemotaxis protein
VLRHLRLKKPSLPVLVLTQRTKVADRVQCLDTGADDSGFSQDRFFRSIDRRDRFVHGWPEGATRKFRRISRRLICADPDRAAPASRLYCPFAQRLNNLCAVRVREAVHRDPIEPGVVYIAPAGQHMTVNRSSDSQRLHSPRYAPRNIACTCHPLMSR